MGQYCLETCYPFMRYAMFFFNLVFWILGVVLFGFAIWALADPNTSYYFDADTGGWLVEHIRGAAIVVLLISLAIMALGFLGCCGAIKESKILLLLFFISLFLIFTVLFACGVAVLYRRDLLKKALYVEFHDELEKYKRDPQDKTRSGLLALAEIRLNCCGITKNTCDDYKPLPPPRTCNTKKNACQKPCPDEFFKVLGQNMHVFGAIIITIAVLLLFGMMFALCLICGIREFQLKT